MLKVYGLKNCDTCRAARKWLKEQDRAHEFFDVRADGLDAETIGDWLAQVGLDTLLNKRGTTWRKLDDSDKQDLDDAKAVSLMALHPALIKRPVFSTAGKISVGFPKQEAERALLLS